MTLPPKTPSAFELEVGLYHRGEGITYVFLKGQRHSSVKEKKILRVVHTIDSDWTEQVSKIQLSGSLKARHIFILFYYV